MLPLGRRQGALGVGPFASAYARLMTAFPVTQRKHRTLCTQHMPDNTCGKDLSYCYDYNYMRQGAGEIRMRRWDRNGLERWKKCGGTDDEHYILPHRPRGTRAPHWRKKIPWILDQPTTSIYSLFRGIRNAADLPDFRIYDCRVQAITKLLSDPNVSGQVSKEIAGHISQRMQDRYSIQQFSTKKRALDGLDDPAQDPGEPKGRVIAFPEASGDREGNDDRFRKCTFDFEKMGRRNLLSAFPIRVHRGVLRYEWNTLRGFRLNLAGPLPSTRCHTFLPPRWMRL
jgi:hypothetical protein